MGKITVRRVLLIAYHFPPVRVSSGVQRTLSISRNLPEYGWDPIVLTAHARTYKATSNDQLKDIPEGLVVNRAWGLDTARHLAIAGRYLGFMALPDRWASWWAGGVITGLKLIRNYCPDLIWSTYPIATAHLIGLTLHRITGIPWVVDFRDSMTEDKYPREPIRRKIFLWIERNAVKFCSRAVFTTPGAVRMYRERYPEIPKDRWVLIPNGYNEDIFHEVERELVREQKQKEKNSPLILVHSGVLYPSERNPEPFFSALSDLKSQNKIDHNRVRVILRDTGHDEIYRPMLEDYKITDIVELAPGVAYRDALKEMLTSDGLLIFQASNCNHQVPAKIYEYFRAQKPILALTDINGDTGSTLKEAGISAIASLDDDVSIKDNLVVFLKNIENGNAEVANAETVSKYSRKTASKILADIFNRETSIYDKVEGSKKASSFFTKN